MLFGLEFINLFVEKCVVFVVFNKIKWLRKFICMIVVNFIVFRLIIVNIFIYLINICFFILVRIIGIFVDVCKEIDLIKIDGDCGVVMLNINYINVNFNISREGIM